MASDELRHVTAWALREMAARVAELGCEVQATGTVTRLLALARQIAEEAHLLEDEVECDVGATPTPPRRPQSM
jgi:hypothetical protein